MNTVKKITVALVAFAFLAGIQACNKHTCPTYSKANTTEKVNA